VGFWRLDERAGATTAFDSSTRGNNGKLMDLDPATVWGAGRAGNGLVVNAAGYVQVPASDSIRSVTEAVTIAAWVFWDNSPITDWGTAISRQIRGGYDQYYHLSLDMNGYPSSFITPKPNIGVFLNRAESVPHLTWVHLAVTYDGTTGRLYVDGVEVDHDTASATFDDDETPVILAGNGNAADHMVTERFPGRVDEIMLYRRALSADEIAKLHAGALFPPGTPAPTDAGAD
jgi:concanavalin A-like lectin/glucanase superfamily protein